MTKKAILTGVLFVFLAPFVVGQKVEPLLVKGVKISRDSLITYKISITNFSDSIAVLPHSVFFDITETGGSPIGLAMYNTAKNMDEYNLIYAWRDTLTDPQTYPIAANFILPGQKLEFNVALKPLHDKRYLKISYFLVYDLDYRNFLRTVRGSWRRDFKARAVRVDLEN